MDITAALSAQSLSNDAICRKCFLEGVGILEDALSKAMDPMSRTIIAFSCGAVYWGVVGDGLEARRLFQVAIDESAAIQNESPPSQVSEARDGACENLMILSLSYEEYEKWGRILASLQPRADILRGQMPRIREYQGKGRPWSDVMFIMATGYYNRNDPSLNRGMYGAARSLFHLLLENRKSLRVSRQDWKASVSEFAALSNRISSDCFRLRGEQGIDDILPIIDGAIAYVRAYIEVEQGDAEICGKLALLREVRAAICANSGMGLFGMKAAVSFVGRQSERSVAMRTLAAIGSRLATELQDTALEYAVLQAAGMHVAMKLGAIEFEMADASIPSTLEVARELVAQAASRLLSMHA